MLEEHPPDRFTVRPGRQKVVALDLDHDLGTDKLEQGAGPGDRPVDRGRYQWVKATCQVLPVGVGEASVDAAEEEERSVGAEERQQQFCDPSLDSFGETDDRRVEGDFGFDLVDAPSGSADDDPLVAAAGDETIVGFGDARRP